LKIIAVFESLNRLRECPNYELCQLSEQQPGVLDELAAEIKKLGRETGSRIAQPPRPFSVSRSGFRV